jgi:hypothetical protein
MKIAVQGLGEVPTTIKLVLEKEKPNVTYILCSDYQLGYVASHAGYTESNEAVIRKAAEKVGARLVFKKCDVFDPKSICESIGQILREVKPKSDEVVVNYTGGTAVVRLLLGTTGVVLSKLMQTRVVYAIQYPNGVRISDDHTEALRDVFKQICKFF